MQNLRQVSLLTNGQEQVLTIPPELALSSTEVLLRKEGHRLIIEPIYSGSLLSLLTTLPDITDNFPDIDEGLLPLDDITF
ncbi:MAG: AbrB/MazE/SpoVT family DNA-binding domain-containing protein [Microcystis wesenbergii Mw_QC_S_20081001_S30D]|jgi:antitoxin VapB|uniref:AbrB/MazE/SpoVT family DNA-binding domain-containing protein n=1 Tax=Microcystis wesenbergii Mw_QC_S_20081001_S30D TaxID=2486245 RepID=A0A552JEA3_9CHRO|nr:AbrB/MazE/SpoVT family DNA-binding domain-containing protein [Microcystis aeruginosa W11-03]NCR93197.1 AbrB/MazE/SpoVT family DNA-binding domain-containing protein [Microcystis aeruginosa W11-06]TRU94041.1 MAG: AbrB/MazE/SpoVT family DNA-binding domain-containing protein [Microcystis wesenbergii Mw_QC_S_20081001_S30D]TRU96851.1 MAG: AbrB/MazE/SpoVT family DNA-binding domain-containing protein [Microcystis wesenbergii Mw_QC_S_20081001_S30]TRV04578.1 MAG: AbrB/MazE/SpoVT family DNA-binding dom